tara:strand:+ start:2602 stop:3321 length:720 start_codon:yes stop_codon:yes gene_type:complete
MKLIDYFQNNEESMNNSLKHLEKLDNIISCHGHIHILFVIIDYLKDIYKRTEIKYLEIGVFKGSSICLCMQNPINVNYTGIDFFNVNYGHKYPKENVIKNIDKYNIYNHKYQLITGNSTQETTYKQLNGLYDIIFIDGDHSYSGVLKDFNIYNKFIKNKSFIIFDDYVTTGSVKSAVDFIVKNLNKKEWIIHGNSKNFLPNLCSRISFKNHKKIISTHHNAYLDEGKYLKNNEFIIEKI